MAVNQLISPLMGVSFRPADIKQLVSELEPGDSLIPMRDPLNQYDANAIKIMKSIGDPGEQYLEFLGFVAKEVAIVLAPILDANEFAWLNCTVSDVTNPKKPNLVIEWEQDSDDPIIDDLDDEDDGE